MRHGEAEMFGQSDKVRHLTAQGIIQAQKQGEWLKQIHFDKVIVSPYTRALETFSVVNQSCADKLSHVQELWEGITPYGDADIVYDYLAVLAEQNLQNILIISHLPLVEDITDAICARRQKISFYPATIAKVNFTDKKLVEIKQPV